MKTSLFALLLLVSTCTFSNTITVTNLSDSGFGSLRDAVINALSGDTIRFDLSLLSSGSDTLVLSTEILINKNLNIIGLHSFTDTLYLSGNGVCRIFNIDFVPAPTPNQIVFLDSLAFIDGYDNTGGGGGIRAIGLDSLILFNSIVRNCSTTSSTEALGGGIYANCDLTLKRCLIEGNTAFLPATASGFLLRSQGGGIYCVGILDATSINVENNHCSIHGNKTLGGSATGGGIGLGSSGLRIKNSNIHSNQSDGTVTPQFSSASGGGIYIGGYYFSMEKTHVNNNLAKGSIAFGGGLVASFGSTDSIHEIDHCRISHNKAVSSTSYVAVGGGMRIWGESKITYSTIDHNSVYAVPSPFDYFNAGGGIIASNKLTIRNSTIAKNKASKSGGAIVSGGALILRNSTIAYNHADSSVGGIFADTVNYKSSIVALNSNGNFGGWNPSVMTSGGYNLLGDPNVMGSVSSDSLAVDSTKALLGPLQYNGGSFLTMQPEAGSIALNNGNPLASIDAQNGSIVGITDIGAAESRVACETFNTINPQLCNYYYFSPSGQTYSYSQSFIDTLINNAGCDSLIYVDLTINFNTSSNFKDTACIAYISPSGKTFTSNQSILDTIHNAHGCDSLMSIDVVVVNPTFTTINESVCYSYISPSGKIFITSQTFTDTITNSVGCDSIMTIKLLVNSSSSTITDTVCDLYTSPSGKLFTNSQFILDTIPNFSGCDSVIAINLTVNNSKSATLDTSVCKNFTSPSGISTWTQTGTYFDTIPTSLNCDSLIQINLTVTSIDTSLNYSDTLLSANGSQGDSYVWVHCDSGFAPISGANGQQYAPSQNGSYAVIITNQNGCSDTTECFTVSTIGINETVFKEKPSLYPNPSTGIVFVDLLREYSNLNVRIIDPSGQLVSSQKILTNSNTLTLNLGKTSGSYTIQIKHDNQEVAVLKVIKK